MGATQLLRVMVVIRRAKYQDPTSCQRVCSDVAAEYASGIDG
jgi:hypothetical protein